MKHFRSRIATKTHSLWSARRRSAQLPPAAEALTKLPILSPKAPCRPRRKTSSPISPASESRPKPSSIRRSIRSRICRRCAATSPAGTPRTCSSRTRRAGCSCWSSARRPTIDLKRVHEKIGAQGRVSFGSAELLEEVWGVRPGAVTPFGAINDQAGKVRVVLDEAMMRHRTAQLSSAGQYPHHRPCERRPGQIPARDRARADGRGAGAGSSRRLNKKRGRSI